MSELAALNRISENRKTKAKFLDISNCGMAKLPAEIEDLVWLEGVRLSGNELVNDLSALAQLKKLQMVDCSSTSVVDLKPLNQLINLRRIYFSSSKVIDLEPLKDMIQLQELSFDNNNINDLIPLAGLFNLQKLTFSKTPVADIAPISLHTGMQILDFSWTMVNDLAPISELTNLQTLNFSYTQVYDLSPILTLIRRIPVRWHELQITDGVYLKNCPLNNPPIEIVIRGNKSILHYFRERDQQGIIKIFEAKMLIVGEGGSGKTSLLRRLFQKDKELPKENESTKGIEIHRHYFAMPEERGFRLNVWDFGGQEIYHATHQFFLTKRSLYVLLDDTRKDHKTVHDDGFKYWLEAIDLLSDHSPVLIFQNEKSGRSKTIDLAGIKGKFDNVKDSWRGNLELPDVADSLAEAIEHFARNLPHIGEELPAKWVSIRAEIEQLGEKVPFITQKEYFDVYARHLEFDRDKALFLSQYLHDLGVFLHFQNDLLLARTVILQNNWATEAVFKMLDDEIVKVRLGSFTEEDCHRVWADSTWADMHPELLALMQKFELCYLLPDAKPKTWLVPQLLPPSKPVSLAEWARPGDLVLRFRYEFLPKGLVSRLMVRQHRFVPHPDMAWTSGVLFERDGAQVLVEIPPKGNEIALRARGLERKELLSVIAADLDTLNETFHGLPNRVSKLIPCNCKECLKLAEPEFFEQKRLLQRKRDGKRRVECPGSYEEVEVLELIDGVNVKQLPGWALEKKSTAPVEIIREINDLLDEGETQKALEKFKKINPKEATILLGTYSELVKNRNRGVLKEEDFLREKAKVNAGLLDLLDN